MSGRITVTIGVLTIIMLVITTMTSMQTIQGYTIDAKINKDGKMYDVKITSTATDTIQLPPNATIVDRWTLRQWPTLNIYPSYIGFSGTVVYNTSSTETRLFNIQAQPDIHRITMLPNRENPQTTTYYVSSLDGSGIGYLAIHKQPSGELTAILHLERTTSNLPIN